MSQPTAPQTEATRQQQQPEVRGVFSTQEIRKVGTGTTTRKTVQKTFWFVEQHGNDIECQPLNTNYVPSGPKRKISMEDLINKFSPEPEFYMNSVYPKMQELQYSVRQGDRYRENGESFAAEYEYSRALKVDEDNVRANFGIGLTYLERGDASKAQDIFERLVKLDAAFEPQHKHLFNEFGISLRKNKMLAESREYYARALQLSPKDENLNMNMARVLLESKDLEGCVDYLLEALHLAPRHEQSLKFMSWLIQKNLVPADKMEAVKQALAASRAAAPATAQAAAAPAATAPASPEGEDAAPPADGQEDTAVPPEDAPGATVAPTAASSDPFIDTTA
ncbi:tetratricopeptide repeat protein [uncultured Desulfovibrio sp.]|uniref:tetratricopeptide repeat protein n=1 Tax=uncultured Desulfovibrio sp. TaxID=167968 RepID=UPI0025F50777|nr:tetratricopeptide repeat protein [uncultured Desulfovibrio sp.]